MGKALGRETELERRLQWLKTGGKWLEEKAWLVEYVARWVNKLWNWPSSHGGAMHHLNKEAHTHEDSAVCTSTKYKRPEILIHSYFLSYFPFLSPSISCFVCLYPLLHGPIHPHLPPLLHFAWDWGSGLCADWGWLEHCALHWGSRNLSPCALNVPLEQQFLWWEIMWWASVKGSGGVLMQGRKGGVCVLGNGGGGGGLWWGNCWWL